MTVKVLPHSVEAEQMVLASLLLDEESYIRIDGFLFAEYFYRKEHQLIFQHIVKLKAQKRNIDAVTVAVSLEQTNDLEYIGGHEYLNNLVGATPSSTNIKSHAEIIREQWELRRIIEICGNTIENCYSTKGKSVDEISLPVANELLNIQTLKSGSVMYPAEFLQEIESIRQSDELLVLLKSNHVIDEYMGGFGRGEVTAIGGRPGMGKTALAIDLFCRASINHRCIFFSLEMSRARIANRICTNLMDIKIKDATGEQMAEITEIMSNRRYGLVGNQVLSIGDIRRRLYDFKAKFGGIDFIFIDYLGLINRPRTGNLNEQVTQLSAQIKHLAIEFNTAIILIVQLNRALANRSDKRPQMQDIRDSGSVEQDMDNIIFVHCEEYYYRGTATQAPSETHNVMEIIFIKAREGLLDGINKTADKAIVFYHKTRSLILSLSSNKRIDYHRYINGIVDKPFKRD